MIANIGPADYNTDETLSTLRYANRAKNIENKPKINEDPKDAMLREFQDEIKRLKEQLNMAGGVRFDENGQAIEGEKKVVEVEKIVYVEDKEKMAKLEKRLAKEKLMFQKKHEEELKKLEAANIAEEERQKLIDDLNNQQEEKEKVRKK